MGILVLLKKGNRTMNQMTQAMLELRQMDELSAMDSSIHRLHPLAKLIVTVAYIFLTASFSKYNLTGLMPMVLYPVLVFQISGIPVRTCFHKLRFILPLVCAVGLWNPFLDRIPVLTLGALTVTGGILSFLTLMLKGVFALMASFLLIATTNIEKICYALRMLKAPEILVTQLLMTYRYVSLLLHETGTMMNAYFLRAPGQKGLHFSAWGSFVGQLLLRSMDRAQELYQSMQMRGFHGAFYYADVEPFKKEDAGYMIFWILIFILLRFCNLSEVIGSLFI